ncbi:hypothetical protein V6U78_10595 [Marinospirillum sp. MEB164]|uniref:Uncharacterized protein n=1 Tax=Marinospirillum alkalitolerans TaxID=3123374 RepID=A0ABW8PYY2_9GAMM
MSRLQKWVLLAILVFPLLLILLRAPGLAPEPELQLGQVELLRQNDQAVLAVGVAVAHFAPQHENGYLWHYRLELFDQAQSLATLEGIKTLEWVDQEALVLFLALDHQLLPLEQVQGGLEYRLQLELLDAEERVRAQVEQQDTLRVPQLLQQLDAQVSWRWVDLHHVALDLALTLINPNTFGVLLDPVRVEWQDSQGQWLPLQQITAQGDWLLAAQEQQQQVWSFVLPMELLGSGIIERLHHLRGMPYQLRWRAGLHTEASVLDLWGVEDQVRGVLEPVRP